MSNKEIDLIIIAEKIKMQWRKITRFGLIGMGVGLVIAFSIPKVYLSSVTITPEEGKGSSSSSIGGLAAMMGVDVMNANGLGGITEDLYPEVVKSTPFLLEFIDMSVPYKGQIISLETYLEAKQKSAWWHYVIGAPSMFVEWVSGGNDPNKALTLQTTEGVQKFYNITHSKRIFTKMLGECVLLERDKKTGIFSVSVKMQDPLIATIVADTLTNVLEQYLIEHKTAKMRKDLEVSVGIFHEAQQKYHQADQAYAIALDQNQNLISQVARLKLDRLQSEKQLAFTIYQQMASQVEMNRIKLQENTPVATIIEPAMIPLGATEPNKKMIVIIFTLIGVIYVAGKVTIKAFLDNGK